MQVGGCLSSRVAAGDTREVARDAARRLDALVLAAGGFSASGAVDDSDVAAYHRMVAVNLTTAPTCTPSLIKSPPPASNEALRTKGFDGGCRPLQAGGPLFPDA